MRAYTFYTLFLLALCSFSACDIINPEEDIPAYIEILPFDYVGTDGSTSEKITEAWISVGNEFVGAFDLPKTIPVLASGEQSIIIDAGIKENGIASAPTIYPFYERYTTSADLVPGEIITIQPSTRYDDPVMQVVLSEAFDDGLFSFSAQLEGTTVDVKEGNGSGVIRLDSEDFPSITVMSIPLDKFPVESNIAYLEMDYKSEVPIFVGVTGVDIFGDQTVSELPYGLNAREDWNKVYFNFSNIFRELVDRNTFTYQIIIGTQIPINNGEFTLENTEIRLDNIKLITF